MIIILSLFRVRAMDGSADLRWRSSSEEEEEIEADDKKEESQLEYPPPFKGPRAKAAKGRSLNAAGWKLDRREQPETVDDASSSVSAALPYYNFAVSKLDVSVPEYSLRGGPDTLATILGTCWRLLYVKCPPQRERAAASTSPPPHPCCRLRTSPGPLTPASNRLSRWLREPERKRTKGFY